MSEVVAQSHLVTPRVSFIHYPRLIKEEQILKLVVNVHEGGGVTWGSATVLQQDENEIGNSRLPPNETT